MHQQKARREKTIKLLPTLTLDRLRGTWRTRSPYLLFAIKSALAAGLSWEAASLLFGAEAASLAVVSALIVVQTTSWQTVRKGVERVLGVIIGVSLAVFVANLAGLNVLTITLLIFCAQIIGMFLQNRGQYLATQIPISAALALLLGVSGGNYPFLRILGAVVGALVGTLVSLFLSPPVYVFKTRTDLAKLMTQFATAMPELANALAARQGEAERREVYTHMRALEQQVHATEQALSLALDSERLNPWARSVHHLLINYPEVLLALDRLVRQMRRIAYTINEPELSWSELVQKQEWPSDYARLLEEIGSILSAAATSLSLPVTSPQNNSPDSDALHYSIEHIRQQLSIWQSQLVQEVKQQGASQTLNAGSPFIAQGVRLVVRGTILTDLRRMLDEIHDVIEMIALPTLSEQKDATR